MSDAKKQQPAIPVPKQPTGIKSETYPKFVVMHSGEDEFKNKVREAYLILYSKMHEVYTTEKIFAMAYQCMADYEKFWTELKTHVNIGFDEDIKKFAGEDALKEIKQMAERGKRRPR